MKSPLLAESGHCRCRGLGMFILGRGGAASEEKAWLYEASLLLSFSPELGGLGGWTRWR